MHRARLVRARPALGRLRTREFDGPHPAGLPGPHIHFLDPVGADRSVWHIGYQDVIAIGHLFLTGQICTERVVALGGPGVVAPRMIRSRTGALTSAIVRGELHAGMRCRVISGSVLSGRIAAGPTGYLGPYQTRCRSSRRTASAGCSAGREFARRRIRSPGC